MRAVIRVMTLSSSVCGLGLFRDLGFRREGAAFPGPDFSKGRFDLDVINVLLERVEQSRFRARNLKDQMTGADRVARVIDLPVVVASGVDVLLNDKRGREL